jgi:hypothetical protein
MPGFGQPQVQQQQQGPPPQQQFRAPQEQTLQAGVKVGAPQQGGGPRQPYYSPAPPQQGQQQGQQQGGQGQGYYQPHVPEFKVAGVGGGPYQEFQGAHRSRFSIGQLRQSDGIIPLQYGTNRFASQKGMTGFGSPRDVNGKHLHRIWDDFYTDEAGDFAEGQQHLQGQQQQYYAQQ